MSNRFITMLGQMAAWDNLVLACFMLAGGLVLCHHNITTSALPVINRYRAQILFGYWIAALVIYLAVAITCVALSLRGN